MDNLLLCGCRFQHPLGLSQNPGHNSVSGAGVGVRIKYPETDEQKNNLSQMQVPHPKPLLPMPTVSFPPGPQGINAVHKDPALSLRCGPWGCLGLSVELLPSSWGREGLVLLAELDTDHSS